MALVNHLSRTQEQRCSNPGSICGESSCLMAWTPINWMGDQQVFLKNFYQLKNCQPGLKRTEMGQNKGKMTIMAEPWMQRTELRATEDYSQALKSNGIFPAECWTCLEPMAHFFLPFSLFWNGSVYPTPVSSLHFGRRYIVFWFHRFTDGEEFCPKMGHTQNFIRD